MRKGGATIQCTHVLAQVSLGFYDEEGNLVGEEMFPQVEGNVLTAKLFHPHTEQLTNLIATCVEQAWAKLAAAAETPAGAGPTGNAAALPSGTAEPENGRTGRERTPSPVE